MRRIAILFLSIVIVLFGSGYTAETNIVNKSSKFNLDKDKKIVLINLDQSIEKNSGSLNSKEIIQACNELAKNAPVFTDEDLLAIILSSEFNSLTKSTLVQISDKINNGNGIVDESAFEQIIMQRSVDDSVRINLIQTLSMESNRCKNNLETIIRGENGSIVVRALIKMQQVDAAKSLEISKDILKNSNNYNDDAIRASAIIMSEYFQDLTLDGVYEETCLEKNKFIDLCINKFNNTGNTVLKDTLVFSLINMLDFNAVKAVIKNTEIDYSLKITCISRNYYTFVDVINNNPSYEDVEFIVSAMEIAPIKELTDIFKNKLLSNSSFNSERLRNIINTMESSGFSADLKSTSRKQKRNW